MPTKYPLTLPMLELPSRWNGSRARYPGWSDSLSQRDHPTSPASAAALSARDLPIRHCRLSRIGRRRRPLAEPEDYPLICSGQGGWNAADGAVASSFPQRAPVGRLAHGSAGWSGSDVEAGTIATSYHHGTACDSATHQPLQDSRTARLDSKMAESPPTLPDSRTSHFRTHRGPTARQSH